MLLSVLIVFLLVLISTGEAPCASSCMKSQCSLQMDQSDDTPGASIPVALPTTFELSLPAASESYIAAPLEFSWAFISVASSRGPPLPS